MANVKKIFFYAGTALVDPKAAYGCPSHPDQEDFDEQDRCQATCYQSFVPVYRCPVHREQVTSDPREKCSAECGQDRHPTAYACPSQTHDVKEAQPGRCTECGKELKATNYVCKEHMNSSPVPWSGKCNEYCGRLMNQPTNRHHCPNHPQKLVDSQKGLCQEPCQLRRIPLKTALGYRSNVSVFMDFVGSKIDNGQGWGFCVNVARDPQEKTSAGTTGYRDTTLHAGVRRFRYYAPEGSWTAKETRVVDYLKDHKVLNGKPDVLVDTAAVLKDLSAAESLGWPARYKISRQKEVDNCSARCFADSFKKLQLWLASAVPDQRVFAVCDCNSFHNSGYLFGLLALSKYVKEATETKKLNIRKTSVRGNKDNLAQDRLPPAVLILNFDRHNDDLSAEGMANSDGWGKALLENFPCGAYLAIGVPPSGSVYIRVKIPKKDEKPEYQTKTATDLDDLKKKLKEIADQPLEPEKHRPPAVDSGIPLPPPPMDDKPAAPSVPPPPQMDKSSGGKKEDKFADKGKWQEVWEQLQTLMSRYTKKQAICKYYYITIDRDCMANNHTQWGDGYDKQKQYRSFFKDQEHISKAVEAIKQSLGKDAVLTGMDITGLPEVTVLPGANKLFVSVPKKKGCNDPDCPYPECERCRTKVMSDLSKEIGFWYDKFLQK